MKKNEERIISAFLAEKFKEHSWEWDEKVLEFILPHIEVEEENDDDYRTIHIDIDAEKNITASSIKLLNLSKVNIYQWLKTINTETIILTGLLLDQVTAYKAISALSILLFDFYPHLEIKFKEQDAKIIYAISKLGKKQFNLDELANSYKAIFTKTISLEDIRWTLDWLKEVKVIKSLEDNNYQLIEKIKNLNRV